MNNLKEGLTAVVLLLVVLMKKIVQLAKKRNHGDDFQT
jgi:hypothetical protein